MKLPEIVYDIKTIIHGGKIPDDTIFDNRLIAHWIDTQRALWLTNEYNKGIELENNEVQTIYDLEFEIIDSSELQIYDTDINVLRSKITVPRTLTSRTRDLITGIRGIDVLGHKLNYVRREQALYSGNGMFNRSYLYVFKHNDYLYIKYGNQNRQSAIPLHLRVEGVFEKPMEVDVTNNTIDNIWKGVTEYPISVRFVQYIKGEIIKADVNTLFNTVKDSANNDEYDETGRTK